MPRVIFTGNLQRHVACPPCVVEGRSAREVLDRAFALYPKARGYVLDEHGGDSWITVSEHLPPVYAVGFA